MLFTAEEAHVSVAYKRGRTESAAVVHVQQFRKVLLSSIQAFVTSVQSALPSLWEMKRNCTKTRGSILVKHRCWSLMLR